MNNDGTPDYWRERTIFPGTVPREVKLLVKNINSIDKSFFRKLIKIALGYLQKTITADQCEVAFENLCKIKQCSSENDVMELSVLYSGIITLLRAVLKINMKTVRQDMLTADLIELGLSQEFAVDICKVVFGPAHSEIMRRLVYNKPHISRLEHMEWKVDPTLTNSLSGKVIEPTISFMMKTSDGETHEFEVPLQAYHALRQSVSTILRHMVVLRK